MKMADFANCQSPTKYLQSFGSVSAEEPLNNGMFVVLTVNDLVPMGFMIWQFAYKWKSDQYGRGPI